MTTDPAPPSAQVIIEAVQPHVLVVPSVDELLSETHALFAYEPPSSEDALRDGLMVMYVIDGTSGSFI